MKKKLLKYLKLWWLMTRNSFISVFNTRTALFIFLFGKLIRFGFFVFFLIFLIKGINNLAGYNLNQTIFFFLTFNLVDIISQFLFREVYRFRPQIVSGDFDLTLVRPLNALFRSLLGGADIIDLLTIPPLIYGLIYIGGMLHPSFVNVLLYLVLILNGLIIAAAFHIAVLAIGVITVEVDNTIMVYRHLVSLGRFPIDIYQEPLRGLLTYIIPVGVMITLPAKILMGIGTPIGVLTSLVVGVVVFFISTRFWNYALRYYTSASS